MPDNLKPFYKNVFRFDQTDKEKYLGDQAQVHKDLQNVQSDVRFFDEYPVLNKTPLPPDIQKMFDEDKAQANLNLRNISNYNADMMMNSPYKGSITNDKRSKLQKITDTFNRPFEDLAKGISGYFKNLY